MYIAFIIILALGCTNAAMKCGQIYCKPQTEFCDLVMSRCELCADACAPGRINQDDNEDIEDCKRKCPELYNSTKMEGFEWCGGNTKCNRTTHYCDNFMADCVKCSDECSLQRIAGNSVKIEQCGRDCAQYYEKNPDQKPCGLTRCDPKSQYCDHVINQCVSCSSICGAADKSPLIVRLCRRMCKHYKPASHHSLADGECMCTNSTTGAFERSQPRPNAICWCRTRLDESMLCTRV